MRVEHAVRAAELAAGRAVINALRRELGITDTLRVIARIIRDRLRGRPFGHLGPPVDERDRLSRAQAAELILLDRALRRVRNGDVALRIARAAVIAGGGRFLSLMIPRLPSGDAAGALADRFFNAEGETAAEADRAFTFTVHRCRFVELLAAAEASHLAPLFCEVDAVHFARADVPVRLTRTKTLATGGDCCDFRFDRE